MLVELITGQRIRCGGKNAPFLARDVVSGGKISFSTNGRTPTLVFGFYDSIYDFNVCIRVVVAIELRVLASDEVTEAVSRVAKHAAYTKNVVTEVVARMFPAKKRRGAKPLFVAVRSAAKDPIRIPDQSCLMELTVLLIEHLLRATAFLGALYPRQRKSHKLTNVFRIL